MEDFDGNQRYAEYVNAKVADEQVMTLEDLHTSLFSMDCNYDSFSNHLHAFITCFLCRTTTV